MKKGNPQRLAQQAGRRFERRIRDTLRHLDLDVDDTDETTGYTRGVDLYARFGPSDARTCAIQCKATKQESSLLHGFIAAKRGAHWADAWACVHSYRQEGQHPKLRIRLQFRHSAGAVELSGRRALSDLAELLHRAFRPRAEPRSESECA